MPDYPKLDIVNFGMQLLRTGDLDPIYIALHRLYNQGQLREGARDRWLVSYWCFYSAGVASYMSQFQGEDFWRVMHTAAENKTVAPTGQRWERGSERRHFRGEQGLSAVRELRNKYHRPEAMVEHLSEGVIDWEESKDQLEMVPTARPYSYDDVSELVKSHRGFGSWISYKVADMLERVVGVPIKFTLQDAMYDQPWSVAVMIGDTLCPEGSPDEIKVETAVSWLLAEFGGLRAPPRWDRDVSFQEIETILCKWKSHMNGQYPLLKDTHEIRHGLLKWRDISPVAAAFLDEMPDGKEKF